MILILPKRFALILTFSRPTGEGTPGDRSSFFDNRAGNHAPPFTQARPKHSPAPIGWERAELRVSP
jgi:hypothetical protein